MKFLRQVVQGAMIIEDEVEGMNEIIVGEEVVTEEEIGVEIVIIEIEMGIIESEQDSEKK